MMFFLVLVLSTFTAHLLNSPALLLKKQSLEVAHNLFSNKDKKAILTICRLLLGKCSLFFQSRRYMWECSPLATYLQYIQHTAENIVQVMGMWSGTTTETLQMTWVGRALGHRYS
jgi:hypothetical protein